MSPAECAEALGKLRDRVMSTVEKASPTIELIIKPLLIKADTIPDKVIKISIDVF